jgi:molybdate transport system substrate-binding protein
MNRKLYRCVRISVILILMSLAGLVRPSGAHAADPQILVVAAVSLENAFQSIAHIYKRNTGVSVTFDFGASGALEKQIEAGAPADVFASAGEKEMQELQSKGLIELSTRANFVRNSLVLVKPAGSKPRLSSFSELRKPQVKMIAIGNPKTVPAGRYAKELLQNTRLWLALKPRLVFAEDVRQVLDYVDHGEVDAGIVYATDVGIAHGRVVMAARAPDGEYGPVLYPIAVVKDSRNDRAAREFVQTVLSPAGMTILKKYGFLPAK